MKAFSVAVWHSDLVLFLVASQDLGACGQGARGQATAIQ